MNIHVHIHRRHATHDAAPEAVKAAGVAFFSPEGRVLLLLRDEESKHGGTWGLPAGGIEPGESPVQAARREFFEETDYALTEALVRAWSDGGFVLFVARGEMFIPRLNHEHSEYVWALPSSLPVPLHPNLRQQIATARYKKAGDA